MKDGAEMNIVHMILSSLLCSARMQHMGVSAKRISYVAHGRLPGEVNMGSTRETLVRNILDIWNRVGSQGMAAHWHALARN